MNNSLKYISVLIVSYFIVGNINAQDLSDDQQKDIQARVIQATEEFQYRLSAIANKKLSHAVRKEHVYNTLKLFIGNGEQYSYSDEKERETAARSGVKIQLSDHFGKYKKSQLLKKFIYNIYNPDTGKSSYQYNNICIEAVDAVVCDNILKVDDHHYECTAYYHTKILERRTGDRTKCSIRLSESRKIHCYIQSIESPAGETLFEVKLGDIYVIQ